MSETVPLKCLVWAATWLPPEKEGLAYALDNLDLLEAHTQEDLHGKNVVKVFDGQKEHPLHNDAMRRVASRMSGVS